LVHSGESVANFVMTLGVRTAACRPESSDDSVCGACMTLVVKIDRTSYELDNFVSELRSRVEQGAVILCVLIDTCHIIC
jgi:hypothetical protein